MKQINNELASDLRASVYDMDVSNSSMYSYRGDGDKMSSLIVNNIEEDELDVMPV
jgi:hypothetical protein